MVADLGVFEFRHLDVTGPAIPDDAVGRLVKG
jgi:hypothetical protein